MNEKLYSNYLCLVKDVMLEEDAPAAINRDNWEEMLKKPLDELSETMDPKYTEALRLRYGLDTGEFISFAKVGTEIGRSPSTARRTVGDAMRRLRHPSRNRYIRMLFNGASVDELREQAVEVRKMYERHVNEREQGV